MLKAFNLKKPPKQSRITRCFYISCLTCIFFYTIVAWWAALFPASLIDEFEHSHRTILITVMFEVIGFSWYGYAWFWSRIIICQPAEWFEQNQVVAKRLQFALVSIIFITMILPIFIMKKGN